MPFRHRRLPARCLRQVPQRSTPACERVPSRSPCHHGAAHPGWWLARSDPEGDRTMPYGKKQTDPVELCRARSVLRQQVHVLLRASGLEICELANGLAIRNPRDPDRGSIVISYTSGEVSWKRTIWEYLGPLKGHEPNDDPDREPAVDAATIISMLTGTLAPGQPVA